jgi:hypothetical protein
MKSFQYLSAAAVGLALATGTARADGPPPVMPPPVAPGATVTGPGMGYPGGPGGGYYFPTKHGYNIPPTLGHAVLDSHPNGAGQRLALFFQNFKRPTLPVYQAAPWYNYWPYDAHFLMPAPISGQFYGPPMTGNFPVNPYFPGAIGGFGTMPGGPPPGSPSLVQPTGR